MQQYEIKLNTTPIIDAVRAGRPCQERERWQKKTQGSFSSVPRQWRGMRSG
jgi:hypothetical protein